MDIHRAVKAACALRGLDMASLSNRLGHHANYLSQLKGRNVNTRTIERIAAELGMAPSELVKMAEA